MSKLSVMRQRRGCIGRVGASLVIKKDRAFGASVLFKYLRINIYFGIAKKGYTCRTFRGDAQRASHGMV